MSRIPLVEARGVTIGAARAHASDGSTARPLVEGLDWRCLPGERWCLIGRNAVGKTTLLRSLAGLPVPGREGAVLWQGRDQSSWSAPAAAGARAFMAQQAQDRFSLSSRRLVALSTAAASPLDALAVFDRLDIAPLIDRDVMRLSGGERQRVALAQCALQGAPLMLLDEPVAFQDPAHQAQIGRWLIEAFDEGAGKGATQAGFVIAAHDVNWIARVATHVLALYGNGRWRAGTVEDMMTIDVLSDVYRCGWTEVRNAPVPAVSSPMSNSSPVMAPSRTSGAAYDRNPPTFVPTWQEVSLRGSVGGSTSDAIEGQGAGQADQRG